jgi:hypothetical protein
MYRCSYHCSLTSGQSQSYITTDITTDGSFYRFRTDLLKTTLVTSQLRHSNGLLRMDWPTEDPASKALQYITPHGDGCLGAEACGEVDVMTGTRSVGRWRR